MPADAQTGRPAPLGSTVAHGGTNFSLFSRTATGVELLLFDHEDDPRPSRVVRLDPADNRAYHYWHTFVPGVGAGQLYGYRVEGPTDDPAVGRLRNRQVKNFLTVTMMSLGVPMIVMGDEVRQTQRGNNNAYCQDNEISWLDWSLGGKHADVLRFVSLLNARRLLRDAGHERRRTSLTTLLRDANKAWHGVKPNQPDWGDGSRSVALSAEMRQEGLTFYLALNAYWEPLDFELPPGGGRGPWRRWIDTALDAPQDIVPWQDAAPVRGGMYRVEARSVVMLFAGGNG